MLVREHINMYTQKRTHTYMDVCARGISDVTRFHRVSRMIIDDFGELCLTNAHLAFRPKGFSRRFAPLNDNGYAFTLLHMCILPHLRITTLPLMTITTIPYYHVRNRDADE